MKCPARDTFFKRQDRGGVVMSKVLIVESYSNLASLYREILSEDGHQVFVASSSKEAKDIALSNDIDLVIVDEGLPDRREDELMGKLKTIQPHIKAIVCSLSEFSPKTYRDLCDKGFLKTSDYTILQKTIHNLAEKIPGRDQEGFRK
jgi:DNA-binding NtrC family response regulator